MNNKFLNIILLIVVTLIAGITVLRNNLAEQGNSINPPEEENATCTYVCDGTLPANTSRCTNMECRPKEDKSKPKILYQTFEGAVCGANYYGKQYPQKGNRVYKCPRNYGYHLTTHSYETGSSSPIESGKIIDTTGREISSQVCPR